MKFVSRHFARITSPIPRPLCSPARDMNESGFSVFPSCRYFYQEQGRWVGCGLPSEGFSGCNRFDIPCARRQVHPGGLPIGPPGLAMRCNVMGLAVRRFPGRVGEGDLLVNIGEGSRIRAGSDSPPRFLRLNARVSALVGPLINDLGVSFRRRRIANKGASRRGH